MKRDEFEMDNARTIDYCFSELAECGELNAVPLPSPDLIWWRAQLLEKRRLARRSVLAIDAVRTVAVVLASSLMLILTTIWSPQVLSGLLIPVPIAVTALVLLACSTGCVLLAWARQR